MRDGVGEDNLCIWRTADGSLAKSYIQKGNDGWQPQWTGDDSKLLQRNNNQISIFDASDLCACAIVLLHHRVGPDGRPSRADHTERHRREAARHAGATTPCSPLTPTPFNPLPAAKRVEAVPVENIASFAVSPRRGPITFAAFIKGKKVRALHTHAHGAGGVVRMLSLIMRARALGPCVGHAVLGAAVLCPQLCHAALQQELLQCREGLHAVEQAR